ncbi:MAG: hypothetical protein R3E58_12530 [Phycisphaerae bacterium]
MSISGQSEVRLLIAGRNSSNCDFCVEASVRLNFLQASYSFSRAASSPTLLDAFAQLKLFDAGRARFLIKFSVFVGQGDAFIALAPGIDNRRPRISADDFLP